MAKKLTIEFVQDEFFKELYILLTKVYINSQQKLEYICPEGHRHSMTWTNWQQGQRCPTCYYNSMKLIIEFIRESFEKHGYEFLTKVYKNNHQKLDYICPEGHRHSMTWTNWQQGHRCPTCFNNNKKHSIEFVKESFENDKYNLITKKYINSKQKLEYICPNGHRNSMNWDNWKYGRRCPTCAINDRKLTIEFVRECFEEYDYELLTKIYINSYQKLEYICPKGHRHFITWDSWKQGYRCPTCAIINKSGCNSPNWKGGISKEPYCQDWTRDLKDFVKERDDYKCMNPDCWGKDDMLHVHHINYNKKSCGPENLITVCRSCNIRANKDRNWHEAWYKAILHRRYGYVYGG